MAEHKREQQGDRDYVSYVRSHKMFLFSVSLLVVVAVVSSIAVSSLREAMHDSYEVASLKLFPNADRAFAYGEEHFDATDPAAYNINLADYFFLQAQTLDPDLPYLDHELARIFFLKGEFGAALLEIDIQIADHGDSDPSAYYVRGLIEGYRGEYAGSAADYAHFLQFDPHNWAALNDEAWVLLKAQRYQEALQVTSSGLSWAPQNAWLLNSKATALYELGRYDQALATAGEASVAVSQLTPEEWEIAYPGNDPAVGPEGLAALQKAIADNIHMIQVAYASSTIQSKVSL